MKKPHGKTGVLQLDTGFLENILPDTKAGKEFLFAEAFIRAAKERNDPYLPEVKLLSQQGTESLDFQISVSGAPHYLELKEIAPLDTDFGQHALATGELHPMELAEWINKKLTGQHYANPSNIVILLYTTYWQFFPAGVVTSCLARIFRSSGVQFHSVFVCSWLNNSNMVYERAYPNGQIGFYDPSKHGMVITGNITKAKTGAPWVFDISKNGDDD